MKNKATCISCAKTHRKCDQQKPICGRCSRLGIVCIYNTMDSVYIKPRTSCLPCAKLHYKCDKQKPACGRCTRLDKTCSYSTIENDGNHRRLESVMDYSNEQYCRLRDGFRNNINSIENITHKIQKEYNAPKSQISMCSIILSSPINRNAIMEFIKGSPRKKQMKTHVDKNNFSIHQYTKKQNLEMLW